MASNGLKPQRSFSSQYNLLPAVRPKVPLASITQRPAYSLLAWTFGRGTVVGSLIPHPCVGQLVLDLEDMACCRPLRPVRCWNRLPGGKRRLQASLHSQCHVDSSWYGDTPLTATIPFNLHLGVVIGFVISYRAVSG